MKQKKKVAKSKNCPTKCNVHIKATSNNTYVTLADETGNVLKVVSAGKFYKGSKKSTPYAAKITADKVAEFATEHGVQSIAAIIVQGPGPGRESAIRAIFDHLPNVGKIIDTTSVPYNGAHPPKRRKV